MFSKRVVRCGDACRPGCATCYFGIENTYVLGLHGALFRPVLAPDAPADNDELKYHLGLWFTPHGLRLMTELFERARDRPAATCSHLCDHRWFGLLFGTTEPEGMDHLTRKFGKAPPPAPLKLKKPTPKKGAKPVQGIPKPENLRSPLTHFVVGLCAACFREKTAAASAQNLAAKAAADATQIPSPSTPDAVPGESLPSMRRTQTCFCDECENPPARYARLDDSDLED